MWVSPSACLAIIRSARETSEGDGDEVLGLCEKQSLQSRRDGDDILARHFSARLTSEVLQAASMMQEQTHRRYDHRRRDLFDQAQLFADVSLSPSAHILPQLIPKDAAHDVIHVIGVSDHAADRYSNTSRADGNSVPLSTSAAVDTSSFTPIITLPSRCMSPHEYYKHRCDELGVRTQRAVVEALIGVEGTSPRYPTSKYSSISNPVSPASGAAAPPLSIIPLPSNGWTLNLSRVLLGKRGVVPLLDTLQWIGMKRLVEQSVSLPVGLGRKQSGAVLPLVDVNVSGCGLTDVAVDCLLLLISQYFPNVEAIDVSNNGGIGFRGGNSILEFVTSSPWSAVRRVHSSDTSIRPATARTIDTVLSRRWSCLAPAGESSVLAAQ
jgi:hypothetical protein